MIRKILLVFFSFLFVMGINVCLVGLFGYDKLDVFDIVWFVVNLFIGVIDELIVEGDKYYMNWIVKIDGS